MLLRSATIDDFQKIADLNTASWRFAYRAALSEEYLAGDVESDQTQLWESRLTSPTKNQHILLAEEAGYLVGFACVYVGENPQWGSYLNNIHVAHASQGAGVGRQLLNAVAGLCSKSCHGGLYLWVLQSNVKAQGFYAPSRRPECWCGHLGSSRRNNGSGVPLCVGKHRSSAKDDG